MKEEEKALLNLAKVIKDKFEDIYRIMGTIINILEGIDVKLEKLKNDK